jgi:Serine/threonine protein kinase
MYLLYVFSVGLSSNQSSIQINESRLYLVTLSIPKKAECSYFLPFHRKLKPKDDKAVYQEVNVMKNLRKHPNIVNLVNFFESDKLFHVVLELAEGGDVFDRLSKRRFYTEIDARSLARNVLVAVDCIHSSGYVHRDLKPDNLLLKDQSDDSNGLMVADFGFAKENKNNRLMTRCGKCKIYSFVFIFVWNVFSAARRE